MASGGGGHGTTLPPSPLKQTPIHLLHWTPRSPLLPSGWNNEARVLLLPPPPSSLPSGDNQLSLECLVFPSLPLCPEGKEGRELAFRSLKLQGPCEPNVGVLGPEFKGICLAVLVLCTAPRLTWRADTQPTSGSALLPPTSAFTSLGHIILTCTLRITDHCGDKCCCLGDHQMVPS